MGHAKIAIAAAVCAAQLGGCASYRIYAPEFDGVGPGGQPYQYSSTSVLGDQGLSTEGTGYTATECPNADLAAVGVRRNFGQTIVTLLTLGVVSPATVEFYCAKPPDPPIPCDCEDDETGG
ncbi:MAG: hypothetical protein HKN78_09945 [Sphingomonadaceae bacterium]|nr:hypothetical protein [Sphingomonadaceae bacterium]